MFSRTAIRVSLIAIASTFVLSANTAQAVPLSYAGADTRSQGAFAASAFSDDGDGSLKLETFDNSSQGKVSVVFGTGSALGTLGDLSSLTVQYYRSSDPANNAGVTAQHQFAYRLWTNATGTQALVWENQDNGNGAVPLDSWESASLAGGNFWQRTNSTNYNAGGQAHPLSYYAASNTHAPVEFALSSSTPIYGLEVAFGSGLGAFTGYVDNLNLTFGTGDSATSYSANIAVPEPAAIGMLGVAGLALLGRKRRTA